MIQTEYRVLVSGVGVYGPFEYVPFGAGSCVSLEDAVEFATEWGHGGGGSGPAMPGTARVQTRQVTPWEAL